MRWLLTCQNCNIIHTALIPIVAKEKSIRIECKACDATLIYFANQKEDFFNEEV